MVAKAEAIHVACRAMSDAWPVIASSRHSSDGSSLVVRVFTNRFRVTYRRSGRNTLLGKSGTGPATSSPLGSGKLPISVLNAVYRGKELWSTLSLSLAQD
jgi:hypothetical protein